MTDCLQTFSFCLSVCVRVCVNSFSSHAMTCLAQAVSDQHVSVETTIQSQANPLGICGGKVHWARLLPEYYVFLCQYHFHCCFMFLYLSLILCKHNN